MTTLTTRIGCALLSVIGTAALVAFADPAGAVGAARLASAAAVVAAATPVATARG